MENIPVALALVAIATCMFFAAISGSGPATVAAIGGIMFPAMAAKGYDKKFSAGLVASAGCIGVVIPPSIPMVIYGVSSGVSVSKMFLAGIIPGVLIGFVLMLVSYYKSKKEGYVGETKTYSAKEIFDIIYDAKWAIMVPIIILGGIYGGIFTPTEAAAVAVIYGFFVGMFVYKDLTIQDLYHVFTKSALTTSTVMIIVGTATVFGRVLAIERIPVMLAESITNITANPLLIMIFINILFLVVGCFMETLAAIIILSPILLPVATAVGVDPIHFGIIMIVNLSIGFITPPLGLNLFVSARVAGLTLEDVSKGVLPFLFAMLITLILLTYIPTISLFLPNISG